MKDPFFRSMTTFLYHLGWGGAPAIEVTTHPTREFSSQQALANILALLSGSALSQGLSAVVLIIIARQIGPEAYGQYSASIALVGLTTVFFSLGLENWLLYQGGRDRERIGDWSTAALSLATMLGTVWLIGLWGIAPYLNQSSLPWLLVVLATVSLWLEEVASITWSAFKVCLRNDLVLLLMTLSQGGFLGISLILAAGHIQNPGSYMGGRLLAACLGTVVSVILLVHRFRLHLRWQALWTTLRGTLPFAASIGFSIIYGRADLAIIGHELGKEAAGIYAPALTLTNALFLIPAAIYGVVVPILSRGYVLDRVWVRRISTRLILAMILLGAVLGLGLGWLSHLLVEILYGAPFQPSGDVLALLSRILILRCPTIALAAVLVAGGWQMHRVKIQAIAAITNVILNFLVVHQLGVMGVATVYLLTDAILLLGHMGAFLLWMVQEHKKTIL